jgi:hypothetical protein
MSLHPGNIISTGTRKREWWTGLTRKIRQSGVAFTINIVVHRKNIEHLEEMIASSAHTPHSDSRLEVIPRGEDAPEIAKRSRVVHDRDAFNLVAKIGQAFSTNH